jgi:NAD-dependent dihydropyrimidine dehydrogenase PreA subunit
VAILEAAIRRSLFSNPSVRLLVIPHLYDLPLGSPVWTSLQQLNSDLILFCCLYPRAAYWVLQGHGVAGQWMKTPSWYEEDQVDQAGGAAINEGGNRAGISGEGQPQRGSPTSSARKIWCWDLRDFARPEELLAALEKVLTELPYLSDEIVKKALRVGETNNLAPGAHGATTLARVAAREGQGQLLSDSETSLGETGGLSASRTSWGDWFDAPSSRWYPVLDYSKCRNCLQCLNFCLFGVYSLDEQGRIWVEHPEACRDGCPACARLCPTGAILFPMYPDPSIAGGLTEGQSPATSLAAGGKTLPVLPPIVGRISNAAQLYTESVRTSRNGPPPDELRATPSAGSADDVPLANRSQGMAEDAEPPASADRSSTSFDVSDLQGPTESISPAAGEAKAKKQSISEEELDRYVAEIDSLE